MGNDPVKENHDSNYDQFLVGAARAGGAWRPDLRPDRPFLRLFRNGVVYRHGGTIRAALALALDLDPEAALAFTIENCSITRIDRIDGPGMGHGWRVVRVNQPPR